jgi:hypothetical protein
MNKPTGGQKFKLTRDCLWWIPFGIGGSISCTLKEGEVCEYFKHSHTYTFESRLSIEGCSVVPYYPAEIVEAWGFWFEAIQ